MGKITKSMQPKHRDTLSPWLKEFVRDASSLPLPLIPKKLEEFPSRWPFPRGDLYHWIDLLNRFDNILESFCETYNLTAGPQTREFGLEVLSGRATPPVDYRDEKPWDASRLAQEGYGADGDRHLIISILKFTCMLLERCGNRSIYASSAYLNNLLNSTCLDVVAATLRVSLELAQRYQASVKRMPNPARHVSTALLANHYNIELDRVQCLAQPFVKTPIIRIPEAAPTTPASASKGKEKSPGTTPKNVASMYANDLVSIVTPGPADDDRWVSWGDLKMVYYPKLDDTAGPVLQTIPDRHPSSTTPSTPTPLRRSSTGAVPSPRSSRLANSEDGPPPHTLGQRVETHASSSVKSIELRASAIQSASIYDLLAMCPDDMPKSQRYEYLNRLRICKALLGSVEERQEALAVRLLAITNLAYIHPEASFIEKALKQDNDEPRRFQLVYQLAELIHPSVDGVPDTPRWLQSIALSLLEAIVPFNTKHPDVLSALNANVNHGVLLYVIRKAVAEMKEDPADDTEGRLTEQDRWRDALFCLTQTIALASRIGQDMAGAGLMDILIEMLNIRSNVASRNYSMVIGFLDNLVYLHQGTFQMLTNASGLESIAHLIIHTVSEAKTLVEAGRGTRPEFHASLVDYAIPFHQQQTLKWLLKFIHHVMTNAFAVWGNTDRLLRNLVDNSALLGSLRSIIKDTHLYGSVVWTNAAALLSDFINNDPTSFAAISESGMIQTFLETLTGRPVVVDQPSAEKADAHEDEDDAPSPSYSDESVTLESDDRPHPPTQAVLDAPREIPPAQGILPSTEAISAIPSVLNSLSLNNSGMRMVVASRALESFLEIFESAPHIHCMETDPDLAQSVGSSFDELARHHPALRPAISNAILDMVARVVHLSKSPALVEASGAKLQITDPNGVKVTADRALLDKSEKGKEKIADNDNDVDMADASIVLSSKSKGPTSQHGDITTHIWAVSTFLLALAGTTTLKMPFIREGGIELLLDLMVAPSLPSGFGDTPASRVLSQVASQLIEANQIIGLPSLLNRIQDNLQELQPLVNRDKSHPFFAPFIIPDLSKEDAAGNWSQTVRKVADGTPVVKALVNLQTLIRTLYQAFPFSTRAYTVSLPPVNVYDKYTRVLEGMGPILEEIVIEEMEIGYLVPPHWTKQKTKARASASSTTASGTTALDAEDALVPDVAPLSRSAGGVEPEVAVETKNLSGEEAASTQFKNFHNLCGLLHSMLPSALPFFQNLGRALLSRRTIDSYTRGHQVGLTSVLAETILKQLRPDIEEPAHKNFHYWIVMFHTIHEVLIDSAKPTDRSGSQLIAPVLAAFKEHGGFEVLNAMLQKFANVVCKAGSEGEEANRAKMAAVSMKKILEIYSVVVNGKNVVESVTPTALSRQDPPGREYGNVLVVELRMIILPVIRELWESEDLIAKSSTEVLGKIIDILKAIAGADNETNVPRRSDKTKSPQIFKDRKPPPHFAWSSATNQDQVQSLTLAYGDQDLAREAVYRAIGKADDSAEYCRAHLKGVAGKRNPIPEAEAYRPPASPKDPKASGANSTPVADPMALDPAPVVMDALPAVFPDLVQDEVVHEEMDESESDTDDSDDDQGTASPPPAGHEPSEVAVASTSTEPRPPSAQSPPTITRDDLDEERAKLRKDLIDRCLDVIRAHPDSVFEVADLIDKSIPKGDPKGDSDHKRAEVGDVLANALMSFAFNDDEDRKVSGPSIAAYAHLLSLLLRDKAFFNATVPIIKESIDDYLGFLKLPSAHSGEELSPWIPYVLLIFELLLADDALPVEAKWKPPTGEDDEGELPVLVPRVSNLSADNKNDLLAAVLEILPRIGKEESLAISVLRILVILTRDRRMAKTVADKKNLQRLFLMKKQLSALGAGRLRQSRVTDSIIIVLRHIVEDEKTIRQIMQTEIRQYLSNPNAQRNGRGSEIGTYLRHLSHAALRDPELFVQVTVETAKLYRYNPPTPDAPLKQVLLVLRDQLPDSASPPKDSSIDPAVQGTSDLTISDDKAAGDVKLTTESTDKEMPDAPKTPGQELKRPNLTDPDGVVHFLLCELLNYRDVEDKESPTLVDKDPREITEASSSSADAPSPSARESTGEPREKDKKTSKPVFKSEEHPIFVYRCFLLDCIAELLQCFNRAKVEFINFKRSAPVQNSTPIKPRTSVLNYLLSDLLCSSHTPTPLDSVTLKKKTAYSQMAASVLVSLVTRTGERPLDRTSDNFAYDDEPDLLFVRRFVLDTILRAYKDASVPSEPFEVRYQRMVCLAELMSNMIGEKDKDSAPSNSRGMDPGSRSHAQLKRLMFEKGYLAAMTASIADIDLTFPNVKRTIKYILRVLKALTKTGFELSQSDVMPITNADQPEDDFASSSSLSDVDDDREETPDLYRNSTLGMLEPGGEDDFSEGSDDDDEDMYDGDQYDDELDYGDEMSQDGEDNPSDDEDDELGEMGPIEGLSGEPGVVEVIMGENDDDDDDDMDEDDDDEPSDEDDDDEDDDDLDSDDMEELEDQIQIVDEEGNALADDGGSGWESEEDDEHDEEDEEEMDYEAEAQDLDEHHVAEYHIPGILRAAMEGDEEEVVREWETQLMEGGAEGFDYEEEEDEEEDVDEDLYFDQDHPRDEHAGANMTASLGWDINVEPSNRLRGPGGTRSPFPNLPPHPFMMGGPRDPLGGRFHFVPSRSVFSTLAAAMRRSVDHFADTLHADTLALVDFRSFIRSGTHPRPVPNGGNDGVNPLLVPNRAIRDVDSSPRDNNAGVVRIGGMSPLHGNPLDGPLAFINDLVQSLPPSMGGRGPHQFSLRLGTGSGARHIDLPLAMQQVSRESRPESRREAYQDPSQSVTPRPKFTVERWQTEANIVFSAAHQDKAAKLQAEITGKLVPEAMRQEKEAKKKKEEEQRKKEEENERREEEERKAREAKEAEEKAAKEKKEAEERERAERERAEAAAAAPEQPEAPPAEPTTAPQAMEGVESHPPVLSQPAAAPTERVVTVIRGETVDITELGIDPDYLAALPEEFREEVIAQTVSTRRSQAREQAAAEGENTEVFQEFLEALPDELRMEIVQQERQERRRREREDQRRQAAAAGQDSVAADMDPASILMTFPEALREQVLLDQGDDLMEHLPPELAAEARAIAVRHGLHPSRPQPTSSRSRDAPRQVEASGQADSKPPRRSIVQMLDKAGVATLLRLMFVAQQGSIRNYLFDVFQNVCENRQNRLEVISSLLQILQDGSTDMDAVERSFSHLSLKAKQPREKDPKTPNSSLKRTVTFSTIPTTTQPISTNSDVSPLLIVQQCLDLLVSLTSHNPHVASLFLTEHEIFASTLKRSLSRRGKSKDQNSKAHRFAINSLLSLLDRDIIMESSSVMQHLADLLNRVTFPLQNLGRRKEAEELAKKLELAAAAKAIEAPGDSAGPSDGQTPAEPAAAASAPASTEEPQPTAEGSAPPETVAESSTAKETKLEEKKVRQLTPPTVSEHNLKLVINIFVARECSSKTFQNTISTIKNLSNIPGAKKLFGEELVRQARVLSENILTDLDELLPHILKAESGTEIQGVALAKFSPGASEQNKLLRVLTALDHLFDNKGKKSGSKDDVEVKESTKEDLLGSLYWNPTFGTMWEKLSACLSAIRQRESMLNVATILLPLIESLMVVCKNTTLTESSLSQSKEMLFSSPPPENRIAGLFFTFTEEHRRILNELVRHSPKLMSGTFSLLVKNPKVLEFDNKRNYFNRSVHNKASNQQSRSTYGPLQLQVRREHVFHDSFKALYFKSGNEMKFGKLNIRFHGEEGVDAGGVTREWFQVLARQMFDPNYALFIPVSSDRTTFHPNKLSGINDEHLMFFKFIGRVIGKALYEGRLLDCYFSRAVYKRILGKAVSVKDMESFDPDYYKSLVWMLENDITDIIVETFSVEDDEFGATKVVDLIENGRNIPVTDENKNEYVRLIVEHKLLSSVKVQMEHFLKGFHEIIPEELIAIFNEQELELLISGLPDIDVDDWKSNTEYHNYTAASQQIQWFWRAVRSFDKEERAKLLQFVTGTSKVPLNGFKELEGMNGVSRFNIHRDFGHKDRLPSSHTCFNQLDLPEYESYEVLRSQVLKAITAGSDYFGFA